MGQQAQRAPDGGPVHYERRRPWSDPDRIALRNQFRAMVQAALID